jgi:hypothetical protein
MQIKLCIDRGFQRLTGDMSLMLTGFLGNAAMALVIGSVFYNLPNETGALYSRGALLFFAILMAAFQSALEVSETHEHLSGDFLTALVDFDTLCSTTHRRETFKICLLPSVCRGNWYVALQTAETKFQLTIWQPQ